MKFLANPKRAAVNGVLAVAVLGGGAFALQSTRAESSAASTATQTETVTKADVTSTVSARPESTSTTAYSATTT